MDHHFNRKLEHCLQVLHHLDDITFQLDTYQNILNGIAIFDRTFLDKELLEPIFCGATLIGINLISPFLSLILDTRTTYKTSSITTFQIIYQDLSNNNIKQILQREHKLVNFV